MNIILGGIIMLALMGGIYLSAMALFHLAIPLAAYFTKRNITSGVVYAHAFWVALMLGTALVLFYFVGFLLDNLQHMQ